MKIPSLITFGETMALFMPGEQKGIEHAGAFVKSFGGAESNVAIGAARLGISAGWFGALGADPLGSLIYKTVRGEGVDVSRAVMSPNAPTGLMLREKVAGNVSVYYYRRLSAASQMRPSDLDESYISGAQILHVTGITPALSDSCRETVKAAVAMAKQHGVKVSFDPNLRLKLWSIEQARPVLLSLAAQADYFLPGMDELKLLYGTDDEAAIIGELGKLSAVSIVKGGDQETLVVERDNVSRVPCFHVERDRIIDPIGAGDAFCAGFLTGVLKGYSHEEAARLGNYAGSVVIQGEGDWEAAPTWAQVEAVLTNKAHIGR